MTYYNKKYYPKRPVKSFQDLEVYQKLLAVAVIVMKKLKTKQIPNFPLERVRNLLPKLPLWIAEAHSLRFAKPETAIEKLEEVMLGCNQAVVYLEQYRDLGNNKKIETEFFEANIKQLLTTRQKVLHLQFSWKKFMEQKKHA